MSPEQARREPVTRASDVYSLGATLYRMLAGATPHHGKDVREIVERVATATPVPIEQLCPVLPPAVGLLVRQMMARDPSARPADAAELGARLAATLETVQDAKRTRRRVRSVQASATGWLLGLALAGAAAWAFTHQDQVRELFLRVSQGARPPSHEGGTDAGGAPSDAPPAAQDAASKVADETFAEIRGREEALGPPSRGNADALRRVADDYARMTEVFPVTLEPVVRAHWRARAIRDDVARVTGGDASNAAFADRWVERALKDQPAVAARDPSDVPPSIVPEEDTPDGTNGGERDTSAGAGSVEAIRSARTALVLRADALVQRRQVREAMDLVLEWMREQRLAANARQAPGEVHMEIAKVKEWMRRTARTASSRLEADLASDRGLLRTHLAGTSVLDGTSPRRTPAAALESLGALDPLLVTGLGKRLAFTRRERLTALATVWPAGTTSIETALEDALAAAKDGGAPPRDGFVWLAIEAGRAETASRLLGRMSGVGPDVVTAARAEIAAVRARPAAADAASLEPWRRAHAGTIAVLLVPGGASAPVFSTDDTDRWYESWGEDPR
jgi:hypothetical protein